MNPLNLTGPQFLFFYIAVCLIVNYGIKMWVRNQEAQWPMPKLDMTDPYEIAWLRGQSNEAISVAVFSLLDRGLLSQQGSLNLVASRSDAITMVQRPLEKAILEFFSKASSLSLAQLNSKIRGVADRLGESLGRKRLAKDAHVTTFRSPYFLANLLIVDGLGISKMLVGWHRGRPVSLLFFLCIYFTYMAYSQNNEARTGLGDKMLADLKRLFASLKKRKSQIKRGGETNEAALLAAVFGLAELPGNSFGFVASIFKPQSRANSSSCSSSSCSSSSCSSGSSCGGGGGCGGCGS